MKSSEGAASGVCEANQRGPLLHEIAVDDKFIGHLESEDARVAARTQAGGCPHCQGRLDRADYPRKPRGGDIAPAGEGIVRRISLCCAREGCRRRVTPPSLVFMGRRVYLAVVVWLACLRAERSVTPRAISPPQRTMARWLDWFRNILPGTDFFTAARARLSPPIEDVASLPGALLQRFIGKRTAADGLVAALRFLSPLTTKSAPAGAGFLMDDSCHAELGA